MSHRLRPSTLLVGVLLLGCVTTTATSTAAATTKASAPAKPAVHRVPYKPEVVFSSFGEVDFDRDIAVVNRYHAALRTVQNPCFPGAQTAREKRDGIRSNRICPPEDADASNPTPVKVLVDSMPDGIDVANGKIQVAEGKGITLVGRVKWEVPQDISALSAGEALSRDMGAFRGKKADIADELRHLARAASANLVLLTFVDEKTDVARGAVGLIFHVDLATFDATKNRQGKVPVEI